MRDELYEETKRAYEHGMLVVAVLVLAWWVGHSLAGAEGFGPVFNGEWSWGAFVGAIVGVAAAQILPPWYARRRRDAATLD